ncbi:MAG: DUF1684 domain-containing protein [Vicinamibacterales bacterium]
MAHDVYVPAALALTAILAAAALPACGGREAVSYEEEVLASRAAKDERFSRASDSPIPPDQRAELLPLAYFPPDASYRVAAVLEVASPGSELVMPTSTGKLRRMVRVGRLKFTLKGQSMALGAFAEASAHDVERLFVPFTDKTTGTETYAGGRYLELDPTPTGVYIIDFNRAFNPYCAYNPEYDCPYPPPENRLPVPVRAGERMREPGRTK